MITYFLNLKGVFGVCENPKGLCSNFSFKIFGKLQKITHLKVITIKIAPQ